MDFATTVEVDAPAEALWRAVADVEQWPAWTRSMQEVSWVGGGELAVGSRARVKQPGLPRLVWEVSELAPGRSFTWRTTSPGVTTTGTHLVRPLGSGRAQLTVGISQSGPMAPLVGLLTGRRTGRYIRLEADGLKRCAESAGR